MPNDRYQLPPGPRTPALLQLLRYSFSSLPVLDACARRYGDTFTLRLAGYGTLVILASPDAVKDVFRSDRHTLHSGEGNAFLSVTLGEHSVLVLDGDPHARQRRVLLPPLKGERMRSFFEAMQTATLEAVRGWSVPQTVPIMETMQDITLKVMLQVVLGMAVEHELSTMARLVRGVLELGRGRHGLVLVKLLPVDFLRRNPRLPPYRRVHALDAALFELIGKARQTPRAERTQSVLADLLEATHEDGRPMNDQEVRDALVTLIFAGHDTTSIALSWFIEQTAPRADVMERITDELQSVGGGGPPRADQLNDLTYLDAAIRESLRARTILPFVVRVAKVAFTAGGREYPAGVMLCPCSHLVHRRPELYPDPELFRPDRFLERRFAAHEWFPFGGGTRMCLGMAFAMYEMKVVLSTLLASAALARTGAPSLPVRRGISLAPDDGAAVRVVRKSA